MKQDNRISLYIFSLLLLSGCTSLLVTGASGGVAYTLTNVAYKTIAASLEQVEFANRLALMKMKIRYMEKTDTGDGVEIVAETSQLDIYIDLQEITPKTTKMTVDARRNVVMKDKATAVAIIDETEAMLEKE